MKWRISRFSRSTYSIQDFTSTYSLHIGIFFPTRIHSQLQCLSRHFLKMLKWFQILLRTKYKKIRFRKWRKLNGILYDFAIWLLPKPLLDKLHIWPCIVSTWVKTTLWETNSLYKMTKDWSSEALDLLCFSDFIVNKILSHLKNVKRGFVPCILPGPS